MHHQQYARNSCDTVYPRNMFCFRYISVNTLHKRDDDDDDDDDDNNNNNNQLPAGLTARGQFIRYYYYYYYYHYYHPHHHYCYCHNTKQRKDKTERPRVYTSSRSHTESVCTNCLKGKTPVRFTLMRNACTLWL
jgi:hypothetical protein